MVRRIILVRHGETDWNRERRIQGGSSNPPLNERGKEQAESLALRLSHDRIGAIYSSPLRRTLDTAEAIAGYHQLEVEIEPALREIEAGTLEGASTIELGRRLSELLIVNTQGEELPRIAGGESLPEVQQRGWGVIQCICKEHADGAVVIVSHYFVILAIICSVLGLPLSQITRLRLGNGSISIINLDGQRVWLELFNDTG